MSICPYPVEFEHDIKNFERLYDLQLIRAEFPIYPYSLYESYKEPTAFLILAVIRHTDNAIFLQNAPYPHAQSVALPHRKVLAKERIDTVVRELAEETLPSVPMTAFEPLVRLSHILTYENQSYTIPGVAYTARVHPRRTVKMGTGKFYNRDELRRCVSGSLFDFTNREVAQAAITRIESREKLKIRFPENEVFRDRVSWARFVLHRLVVKPLFALLKRNKKLRAKLTESIGSPQTFLDASCGDSDICLTVAKRSERSRCVANDVFWDAQVDWSAKGLAESHRRIIRTNHNIACLPFRNNSFEVALCKNTLHHFNSIEEFKMALENLVRIASKVIVVDVEKPVRLIHQAINFYYRIFLRDAGQQFFEYEGFQQAIEDTLGSLGKFDYKYRNHNSLHSTLMICEIMRKTID